MSLSITPGERSGFPRRTRLVLGLKADMQVEATEKDLDLGLLAR